MNTPEFSRTSDGRVKITVRSEGERDESAIMSMDDFVSAVAAVQNPDNANPAGQNDMSPPPEGAAPAGGEGGPEPV